MKFPFPSFKKSKPEYFLALDIGTETVKALIFEKAGEKIIILGSSIEYFEKFGIFDSLAFEKDIFKKTISKTIERTRGEAKIKPNFNLICLPANFSKGKVSFHSFARENPKRIIDKKEEINIYQTVLKEARKRISQIYAQERGILPEDIQFVNLKILERKIDGYEVPCLSGFQGEKLDFRILANFLPKDYFKNIQEIIQELHLKTFGIINLAENLSNFFEDKKLNAIFLDIGGEISQIFLVREGKLESIEELEMGGKNFLENLSQNFGMTLERTRNLAQDYSKRVLSEGVRKKIKEIFNLDSQRWFNGLKSKLKGERYLPSDIFLFGGGSQIPEIEEILEEGNWEGLLFTSPDVKIIYPKDFQNMEDKTKSLNNPQSTPSLLIATQIENLKIKSRGFKDDNLAATSIIFD